MKRILILIFALSLFGVWFYQKDSNHLDNNESNFITLNNNNEQREESLIFVPYWTFSDSLDLKDYDSIIYFGVSIDDEGIDEDEDGYRKLNSFVSLVPDDKKKYLVLRVINSEIGILDDKNYQAKIGEELRDVAVDYGFDGVVIDYETSAFGFKSTEEKITNMYQILQKEIEKSNLEFLVAVFGDTYYRARPYNIQEMGKISDGVVVMAYDFHKARFNPGPTFPLSSDDKYGYSLLTMLADFRKDISDDRIIITLGYFGYDWKLSEGGVGVGIAEPLTTSQFEARFIDSCEYNNCRFETNSDTETYASYKDDDGFFHEVWSEDANSIRQKINSLNDKGINRIGFWAYSFY